MTPRRILVTSAGGSPSTNFVRSLRGSGEPFHLIGADCNKYYLQRAETDERHLIPETSDPDYIPILKGLVAETGAELIYSQPDQEILAISEHRDEIGARTFLPAHRTIEICQDKYESFRCWKAAGLTVPETMLVETEQDLDRAFEAFGSPVWLRAIVSPGAARGASAPRTRASPAPGSTSPRGGGTSPPPSACGPTRSPGRLSTRMAS